MTDVPVELTPEERAIDLAIVKVLDRYGEDKVADWDVRLDASPDYVELKVILKDGSVAYWKAPAEGEAELYWHKTEAELEREYAHEHNLPQGKPVLVKLDEQAVAAQDGDFVDAAALDALERHSTGAQIIDVDGESIDAEGRTDGIEITVQEPDEAHGKSQVYVYTLDH